jgi:SAM-dependent methyltransferase
MTFDSYTDYSQKWQSKRTLGKHFAHDFLEKPAIFSLLTDLQGKSILALGCGSGQECGFMVEIGAESVKGIDLSKGLIEQAKYTYPTVEFETGDIGKMSFGSDRFDIVFSSLTLHYIKDWQSLLNEIKKVLKPNGKLIFSTHHPVKWGSQTTRNKESNEFKLGYKKYKHNSSDEFEIYGDYLNFRAIEDTFFGQMKVQYYHRSISNIFAELKSAGFLINQLLEPIPDKHNKQLPPDFVQVYTKIPLFLVIEASLI